MSRRKRVVAVVLTLVVVGSVVAVALATVPAGERLVRSGNAVGLVFLEGIITTGSSGSRLLGAVLGSDSVLVELRKAREDPATRAVVLRINSPGGSAAGSQEIAREVQRLREADKVVVTSMGDVAASGAYWVASATEHIMADPGSLTGSIGVIMEVQNLEGLYGKLGIRYETIKSGPHKDMGSPARPLDPEERAILQGMVDDIFQQFVDAVVQGRAGKMTRPQVLALADGRVFTGRQALQNGLVDELGNLRDSIQKAADLAGIGESYEVKTYREVHPLLDLLQEMGLRFGGAFWGGAAPLAPATGAAGTAVPGPLQRLEWAWWAARQILTMPAGR
ncbi:MAG: signal peptide peptidase SppA [Bacillota bacterium]|nr:signal peptide peptidase SppA [Bacillota bacterium]